MYADDRPNSQRPFSDGGVSSMVRQEMSSMFLSKKYLIYFNVLEYADKLGNRQKPAALDNPVEPVSADFP
jgi:hypothetical protein